MTDLGGSQALHVTLAQVDLSRWGAKASLLQLVWANTLEHNPRAEAARIGLAAAVKHTGLERRYCWRLLRELVAEKVLTLWQPAAGSRAAAYAINLRPTQWRNVPWRVERELAAARIELAVRPPLRAPAQAFVARPGAPQIEFVARSVAPLSGRSGAMGRATNGELVARPVAPQTAGTSARHLYSSERELSVVRGREGADVVIDAISRHTGARIWGEQLPSRIDAVLEHHQAEAVVEWIQSAPIGSKPPAVVAHLETMAASTSPAPRGPDWFRRRALAIEAQLVHLDDDDEHALVLATELAECQNAIVAMNGSHR
jgi:hypothetical protein